MGRIMYEFSVSLIFLCQQVYIFIIRLGRSNENADILLLAGLNCLKDHRIPTSKT